jgi:hypothetical protein
MLINFLLLSSLLFLFSGLALDAGMLQLRKLQLQHAADAAALGAVYEKARGLADWVSAGQADAALNGFTNGVNGVTISIVSPPTSGSYSGNASAIQATVTQTYHAAFMGIVSGSSSVTPGTSAVAAGAYYTDCVYIMGPGTSTYTLDVDSNSGFFSGCNIYVNSISDTILNNTGSTLEATGGSSIKVRGSSSSGNSLLGYTSPTPTFGNLSENDPLAYETAPAFSSCTYTNKSVSSSTVTLNPGTYCGGITINSSTVTFNPGLYIVTGGMIWENASTITGTGVTFYLTAGGGFTYGNFNILNSTVTLSAPTSTSAGGITGIVVFGDRSWSNQGNQGVNIESSYVTTNGIWYVLNTGIYNYVSTLRGTTYLGLVIDNIKTVAATFTIPSPSYSTLTGGSPFEGSTFGSVVQ